MQDTIWEVQIEDAHNTSLESTQKRTKLRLIYVVLIGVGLLSMLLYYMAEEKSLESQGLWLNISKMKPVRSVRRDPDSSFKLLSDANRAGSDQSDDDNEASSQFEAGETITLEETWEEYRDRLLKEINTIEDPDERLYRKWSLYMELPKEMRMPLEMQPGNPQNEYKLVSYSGKGGYGVVYSAVDRATNEFIALKRTKLSRESAPAHMGIEILMGSALVHPNVLKIYKAYREELIYANGDQVMVIWVAMELLHTSLASIVLRKDLNELQIAYIAQEALKGLQYLHSKKLMHRDVKAMNIMTNLDGDVKLVDLGFLAYEEVGTWGYWVGTKGWQAPEIRLYNNYGLEVDIWAFGIVIREMTEGSPPSIDWDNINSNMVPDFYNPEDWSQELRDFAARCYVVDRKKRATAEELLQKYSDDDFWLAKEQIANITAEVFQMRREKLLDLVNPIKLRYWRKFK